MALAAARAGEAATRPAGVEGNSSLGDDRASDGVSSNMDAKDSAAGPSHNAGAAGEAADAKAADEAASVGAIVA